MFHAEPAIAYVVWELTVLELYCSVRTYGVTVYVSAELPKLTMLNVRVYTPVLSLSSPISSFGRSQPSTVM